MRHLVWLVGAAFAIGVPGPARAAELQVLEPADRALVRGEVTFRVRPVLAQGEQFLQNPEISIQDEYGKEITRLRPTPDLKSGITSAVWNSRAVKDGIYLVTIHHRALGGGGRPIPAREDLTLSVRNAPVRPARFTVQPPAEAKPGEPFEVKVVVTDGRGKPMLGARITAKVDLGELDNEVELTDEDGEATFVITTEKPGPLRLVLVVEQLPAAVRVIQVRN